MTEEIVAKRHPIGAGGVIQELGGCIVGIDHIAIAVEDLDEAVDWYVTKLGFQLQQTRVTRGESTAMISAVLFAGSAVVVLVQGTEPASQVSRFIEKFGPGVQHFAFTVRDMDEAMQRVTAAGGGADTELIVSPGLKQVFLRRDVGSGVRVELIERGGGDFSDESVENLFRDFEARDLY